MRCAASIMHFLLASDLVPRGESAAPDERTALLLACTRHGSRRAVLGCREALAWTDIPFSCGAVGAPPAIRGTESWRSFPAHPGASVERPLHEVPRHSGSRRRG